MKSLFLVILLLPCITLLGQQQTDLTEMKKEILLLNKNVETIQLNLGKAENKFKRGIGLATLGYSVTIAGGLMLGRKNDDLGKVLLVSGGVMGITGTILMVDAFKFLGRASKRAK